MFKFVIGLLVAAIVLGQRCDDIPPDTTFPCEFQPPIGGCNPPYTNLIDEKTGLVTFCLVTCNLCDQVDLTQIDFDSVEPVDIIADVCPPHICGGHISHQDPIFAEIEIAMSEAITKITTDDLGDDPSVPVIDAAIATTQVVANAIATAMSEISLRGVTMDSNSFANGYTVASAEAIAEGTAEAYAIAMAESGYDFTELEATTLVTNIQRALTSTAIDLAIMGRTTENITQPAYANAVAEPVANATAEAFIKITGIEQTAIPCCTIQALNPSHFTCFSFCNIDPPPTADRTCDSYVQAGECGLIEGFCECACQTCSVGSEASISTFVDIFSTGDQEQVITAMGEAFASGAAGADAVANVFVEAIAQGNAEAVSSAIAEAFGAQGVPAQAIFESIAQAINEGGPEVVSVVADGFVLAVKGGNANALATAISTVLTAVGSDSILANVITHALSYAIADGECEAISYVVTEAQAVADDDFGQFSDFDNSASIEDCLQVLPATVIEDYDWYKQKVQSDAAIIASGLVARNVTATAQNITQAIYDGKVPAVIVAFVQAFRDGAPTSAVVDVVVQTVGSGDVDIVSVIASAFVAAENSNATVALAEVIAEGLTSTASAASAVAATLSEAILAIGGCGAVESSLAQAKSISDAAGNSAAFGNALPNAATICLGSGGIIANAIATALASNDYTAVAASAAEAFVSNKTQAIVFGFIEAMKNGIDCDVVTEALAPVFSEAESIGAASALSEEIGNAQTVAECLVMLQNISSCRGFVQRSCCGTFPNECGCSRGRCRASQNNEKTIPALGLYVYNGIGSRPCKC